MCRNRQKLRTGVTARRRMCELTLLHGQRYVVFAFVILHVSRGDCTMVVAPQILRPPFRAAELLASPAS